MRGSWMPHVQPRHWCLKTHSPTTWTSFDRYITALSNPRPHLADDVPGRAEAVDICRKLDSSVIVTLKGEKDLELTVEGYLASTFAPALHRKLVVPQMRPGHSPIIPLLRISV